jgi:uncharacterized protein YeaO (DUF488 family)
MKQDKHCGLQIKRVYAPIDPDDGYRILVDRLWPRGIKKEDLILDQWLKEAAPSNEVRRQFNHQIENYDAFQKDYRKELENNKTAQMLIPLCRKLLCAQNVTLLYSAKDEEHNNAAVLCSWLNQKIKGE